MPRRKRDLLWDDARVFLAVARTGTLSGATGRIGGGIATTSRRIARLEAALGVPLFARHQTGYRLTDEGAALVPKAEALEEAARAFGAEAGQATEAAGRVRLATAEMLANAVIVPTLPALLARYPRLELEIATDVASVNLHSRDADVALRMVKPLRGHVTVRRLGTLGFGLYGSRDHVGRRSGAGLNADALIGWSEAQAHLPAAQWIARTLRGRPAALTTTTLSAQLAAATAGLGLAVLPHALAQSAGLVRLPIALGLDQPIWLAVHTDLIASHRVRVVADHLAAVVHDRRAALAGDPAP